MPALPQEVLHAKLRAALPTETTFSTGEDLHPAIAEIPEFGPARIYLWTITHVESEDRPPDEFKIQLILPGQARTERAELQFSQAVPTFLLGYSPDFGVFVAWQAELHREFAFSKAVQVKESILAEARLSGWSVASPRRLRAGAEEVRVAFAPANLMRYVMSTQEANIESLSGSMREAHYLLQMATAPQITLELAPDTVRRFVRRLRRKIIFERFSRDAVFGPLVKEQYEYACAICGTQLEIVEGAHIIPVSVEQSEDEVWNGIALCPNHHKLFDAYAFIINPDLNVKVDQSVIEFFNASGRMGGLTDALTRFDEARIRAPRFFERDARLRQKLIDALTWRQQLAAVS